MKKFIIMLLLLGTVVAQAQIFTQSSANGSVVITPAGLNTKNNIGTDKSNVILGDKAMYHNTGGTYNTAFGYAVMFPNTSGCHNTANGYQALYTNTSGSYNTAIGFSTGGGIVGGNYDTFVGYNASATSDFSNAMALGANVTVNDNNKVRIGDANVKVIEGQVAWSNPSDRRLKENILYTNRLGLDFITQLQTVSYNYIADTDKTRYDGFIAQDVEHVMQRLNVTFSGLKKSADGLYSLAYSDFVMPLVNAVKEQQQQINELRQQNEKLLAAMTEIIQLKSEIANLKSESQMQSSTKR